MAKKTFLFSTFLLMPILAFSQSILMTINQDTVYTQDFEKYQKKSLQLLGTDETLKNYTDFSLLKDYALENGALQSEGFRRNAAEQINKLKDSLFYPTGKLEPLLQYYHQKMLNERKVQILLFKNELLPKDSIKREAFVQNLINNINSNKLSFREAVEKYSFNQDYKNPTYLPVFVLKLSLENAVYQSPLNKVTKFYDEGQVYLILVTKERKSLGEVTVKGVFVKDSTSEGEKIAQEIYQNLKNSSDFLEDAKKYSQEYKNVTVTNCPMDNDDLYNNVVRAENMDLFPPIKTNQGYYVCRYFFRNSYDNYSEMRKTIYTKFQNSAERAKFDAILIQDLKKNPKLYQENTTEISKLYNSFPKTYAEFQKMNLPENETVLVRIGGEGKLTDKMIYGQLKSIPENEYPNIKKWAKTAIDDVSSSMLYSYYSTNFSEMDNVKSDVKDAIDKVLISYAISYITAKAQTDTEGQKAYLQKEQSNLMWGERLQAALYYCLNEDVEKQVLDLIKKKKSNDYIKDFFKGKVDDQNQILVVTDKGKFTGNALDLPVGTKLQKKVYTVQSKGRFLVVNAEAVVKPEPMSLEELQTQYLNEYSDYAITETINEMHKKAVININQEQVDLLKQKYH